MNDTTADLLYSTPEALSVAPRQELAEVRGKALDSARKRLRFLPISEEIRERMAQLASNDTIERTAAQEWLEKQDIKLLNACETDTHIALMEGFDPRYQDMALEMTAQFIEENKCVSVTEKMQAEVIVGSYIRWLDGSRKLNKLLDYDYADPYCASTETKETTGRDSRYKPLRTTTSSTNLDRRVAVVSRQVDCAARQFHSALATFKQWRMGPIALNINTNNAFVAQNVQR